VNITPVVKEQAANPPQTNKSRLNEYIESYNKKLKELAEENAFPLVDVFGAFSNQDYARLLDKDDGLHPNNEGHKLIFSLIQKEIEKILI
jgi:lysophospholipase L1-like esterase